MAYDAWAFALVVSARFDAVLLKFATSKDR
jgi:hypothetical protein